MYTYKVVDRKIILKIRNRLCETPEELLSSDLFRWVLSRFLKGLGQRNSILLNIFENKNNGQISDKDADLLTQTLQFLIKVPANLVPSVVPHSEMFFKDPSLFSEFIEQLYNFWRSFDRFIICDSQDDALDQRPYRTFNETIEQLMHLVRFTYRTIEENITGDHPRIYRQVRAGAEVASIAVSKAIAQTGNYQKLNDILMIRQILLYPPLVINPPMNKRTGKFEKISVNPLDILDVDKEEWLCYPAKVGPLLIYIYFHEKFFELGFSLSNLFELASSHDLEGRRPDAYFLFGARPEQLSKLEVFPTVFYDDEKNGVLVAASPSSDEFGYFGYLKKMTLTLHNIKMMKEKKMPFHGALVRIILKGNKDVTILLIGDTGAGKSETLEAFRQIGKDVIQDLIVVADDMGSLDINEHGDIIGYGTEIGAFLRIDDLQPGYAFGQMDRSIIMNPNKINARIVLPVTNFENVIKGHKVDFVLYANNYESIDEEHPIIEKFEDAQQAISIFKEGTVMSKGTTTTTGLVHSYFANVFGPPQYKTLHDEIAQRFFNAFFDRKLFVGQMRTRLGIHGFEMEGPKKAAEELLNMILHH
ncbi:MAG: phosphoenolpyruvate carboxykinase [Candidatus Omnitrophica bacterium]|nr:phosphoenolpyruvate carboxykinase [Candidatus Omnitrophota bacterium]